MAEVNRLIAEFNKFYMSLTEFNKCLTRTLLVKMISQLKLSDKSLLIISNNVFVLDILFVISNNI